MNAGTVSRVLSLIPDRVARAQSGTNFMLEGSSCKHPERIAHVSRFLQWLSPLEALSKDDQKILGLLSSNGRPMHAGDEEDEVDAEAGAEIDAEAETWEPETPAAATPLLQI